MTYEELEGKHDFQKLVEMWKINVGDYVTVFGWFVLAVVAIISLLETPFSGIMSSKSTCSSNQHRNTIILAAKISDFFQDTQLFFNRFKYFSQSFQICVTGKHACPIDRRVIWNNLSIHCSQKFLFFTDGVQWLVTSKLTIIIERSINQIGTKIYYLEPTEQVLSHLLNLKMDH